MIPLKVFRVGVSKDLEMPGLMVSRAGLRDLNRMTGKAGRFFTRGLKVGCEGRFKMGRKTGFFGRGR